MISTENLRQLLAHLGFANNNEVFKKEYATGASIEVNFKKQKIAYAPLDGDFPEGKFPTKEKTAKGFVIHRDTTLNFSAKENFVCLVCVHLLLMKGYQAKHIVFEPAFKVGHNNKPSYGDILVFDKEYKPLVLIENKTYGAEFSKEWNNMQKDGGQLFSYLGPLVNELGPCENLVLMAADFEDNVILKSHIITLKDNEKCIADLSNAKTFSNAQGKYFDVWDETYGKSFETKGLFEDDIEAYSIGKEKYTINDLKELSHAEIKPIYHEFATILRNHAITDFEHSFYILIDLFLCKITDERNNPNDLQFYYKGITRDTPKEYCARLLKLYQQGKQDLFNVKVVNKDENDIRQIFEDTNRSITNGLFAGIKELFEEIKFYNIKKFNFIDVENKEEFEMNFQILIKIAALIQDINLSNSETNHFFGDLFEGLLSKNVHQTEGQFFTPLPIVNFIIKSLPDFSDAGNVKVLDYACGAGHFLTEFVKTYPEAQTYGIEKSQTLSQVAKIATIINGSKDSRIIFKDSLSFINTAEARFIGFDEDSFDCIIANPPYSVKGFLNTLTENDRNQFDLIHNVKESAFETNNSIECFFIERAKHFLHQNGLMGIVLPSSSLSNDKIYTKTRELLFANFNILAIVKLNGRTFGSTGISTIILFAQRVKKNSEGLLHTFIEKKDYTQYLSYMAIDNYIEKQSYNKEDYFAFMQDDVLTEDLENNDVFIDYKMNFKEKAVNKNVQKGWFKLSSFYKAGLKEKSNEYKKLFSDFCGSEEYKSLEKAEYRKQFIAFAKAIESDKLNTFIQIDNNDVVLLQSPPEKVNNESNKEEVVKFLGYDWSGRKGDEGIKYITSIPVVEEYESEGKNDKDAEIVAAINSIKYIDTPLYNPDNDMDFSKFSFAIRKHIYEVCDKFSFNGNRNILEKCRNNVFDGEMNELLSYAKLSDLIDFSGTKFNKAVNLTTNKKIEIHSNYPLTNLGLIAEVLKGTSITSSQTKNGTIKVVAGGTDFAYYHNESNRPANTITISASGANSGFVNYWEEPIFASDCTTVRGKNDTHTLFLYYLLRSIQDQIYYLQRGSGQPHVYPDDLRRVPIPDIDGTLQNQIVLECKKVDKEYQTIRMSVDDYRKKIASIFEKYEVLISNQ
ncbi:MAG: N-6 DNA methylase [Salinivirgaceae bacterium]|nr:N-6 DNA methylase [Salinivirgaceae bacterium]